MSERTHFHKTASCDKFGNVPVNRLRYRKDFENLYDFFCKTCTIPEDKVGTKYVPVANAGSKFKTCTGV
jgi:hypothetical protein